MRKVKFTEEKTHDNLKLSILIDDKYKHSINLPKHLWDSTDIYKEALEKDTIYSIEHGFLSENGFVCSVK